MNNAEQPEFVGFNFMGDIIEHFNDAEKAYQSALVNGFSAKQAEEIRIEVEKKVNQQGKFLILFK